MGSKALHPKVTVLMSVFNGERFLREAIESILNQTFDDFEFLVINDGSSDNTSEILSSYDDSRIRVYHQENMGIVRSLNRGLNLARGEYIARMDADDVSRKDRLALEVDTLEQDRSLTLVGSFYEVIDETGRILMKARLQTHPVYRLWRLRFHSNYAHGSVMYKKNEILAAGGYSEDWSHVEDYDLWLRVSSRVNTWMIPSYLYRYRVSKGPRQVSSRHYLPQTAKWAALSSLYLTQANPDLTEGLCKELRSLYWDREKAHPHREGIRALPATVHGFCKRFGVPTEDEENLLARVGLDALWATFRHAATGSGVGPAFEALRTFGFRLLRGVAESYPEILRKALRLN